MAANDVLLITRPKYDIVTKYFFAWSEEILNMAKQKGMTVCDLRERKATRRSFDSYAAKLRPSVICLNGHGNADMIAGQDDEPLVDASSALPGAMVYARSCDAGERLGPELIGRGTRAFIGYRRKFMFGYLTDFLTRPKEDPIAALFMEPSNLAVSTLIKDHSADEAHRRSREAMFRNYRKMICSTASFEERYASRWLWGNIRHQVLHGDGEACLKR